MKEITLTISDFKETKWGLEYKFCHKESNYSFLLEWCLNGLDMAIYDESLSIVIPKECMNFPSSQYDLAAALEKANSYLNKFLSL